MFNFFNKSANEIMANGYKVAEKFWETSEDACRWAEETARNGAEFSAEMKKAAHESVEFFSKAAEVCTVAFETAKKDINEYEAKDDLRIEGDAATYDYEDVKFSRSKRMRELIEDILSLSRELEEESDADVRIFLKKELCLHIKAFLKYADSRNKERHLYSEKENKEFDKMLKFVEICMNNVY